MLHRMVASCIEDYGEDGEVICEMPMCFLDSQRGIASAGSSAIVKLAFVVGVFGACVSAHSILFRLVKVQDWKGQLPKEVINMRIRNLLGESGCAPFRADIWDAVGIGLWRMRFLFLERRAHAED